MEDFINDYIGQIFGIIVILCVIGFVISFLLNFKKESNIESSNDDLIQDQFQVAIQHPEGAVDFNGKDISFCVQGWDYLNKKQVMTIPYKNKTYENGQVFKYTHLKDIYVNAEII